MQKNLRKVVKQTIERHRMLTPGDTVLVALSGGPDSICLLDILDRLRPTYGLTVCAAHFNHKLRGKAADEDAGFAERVARGRGIAFVTGSADVGAYATQQKLSVEVAGRRLRYEFLLRSSVSLGADKVAMGHTGDDQAETVLMRLTRGAGPEGLAGIPPVRPLADPGPKIIRPLIHVWRSDVMQYVREQRLEYREDATNELTEYHRNKIRLHLLPLLEAEYNPQVKKGLARAATALAMENEYLAGEAQRVQDEIVVQRGRGWVLFRAGSLAEAHPAVRKRVIHLLVSSARPDGPMLEALHYQQADALLHSTGRFDLPGRLRMEVSEGMGLVSEPGARKITKETFEIAVDSTSVVPELCLIVKTKVMPEVRAPMRLARMCTPTRQYFDLDSVRVPLGVRRRRPGDSFRPLGTRGTKKLKDFFIDKKAPRFLRDHIPLLISDGKIMWVMGRAMDRRFVLKPKSSGALRVDYETQIGTPSE